MSHPTPDHLDWVTIMAAGINLDQVHRQSDGAWHVTIDDARTIQFGWAPAPESVDEEEWADQTGDPGEPWAATRIDFPGDTGTVATFPTATAMLAWVATALPPD